MGSSLGHYCGVFGVYAPNQPVAHLSYLGLFALQHRGQESAGIAVSDGATITVVKDMGLVTQVFDERNLASLHGHIAIGHNRYSTTGSSSWMNAQPVYRSVGEAGFALGHNGNLTNTAELAAELGMLPGLEPQHESVDSTTDSALVAELVARAWPEERSDGKELELALEQVLPKLKGGFSFVLMDDSHLIGARDPHGFWPLVLGRLDGGGWVFASESAALDLVGAHYVRDVQPGEMVVIDATGVRREVRWAEPSPRLCLFEFVYFSRPDTRLYGHTVHTARQRMGEALARQAPVDADMVVPVPESGIPAAQGFARASGIPYGDGLVKNRYVGRTFIQPSQTIRQLGIRLKLNPLREIVGGKRLVVVDDSIVRGNTQRAIVRMLREAGASEVHVRISSPPVKWPCFYGIDFATRAELIANGLTVEEICTSIGADSLGYVSLEGLISSTGVATDRLCRACFDGVYPIDLPAPEFLGKHLLEGIESRVTDSPARSAEPAPRDADGLPTQQAGAGATDALNRP